jgi:hypothetical protein
VTDQPTPKQQRIVDTVADYAAGATVRQIADRLQSPGAGQPRFSDAEVRSLAEAAHRKGFLNRRIEVRNNRRTVVYSLVPGT